MRNESYVVSVGDIHFKDYSLDDNSNFVTSYYRDIDSNLVNKVKNAKTLIYRNSDGDFVEGFSGFKVDIIGFDDIKYGRSVCDSFKLGEDNFSDSVLFCYVDDVSIYNGKKMNSLLKHYSEYRDDICDYLYSIYGIGMSKRKNVISCICSSKVKKKSILS